VHTHCDAVMNSLLCNVNRLRMHVCGGLRIMLLCIRMHVCRCAMQHLRCNAADGSYAMRDGRCGARLLQTFQPVCGPSQRPNAAVEMCWRSGRQWASSTTMKCCKRATCTFLGGRSTCRCACHCYMSMSPSSHQVAVALPITVGSAGVSCQGVPAGHSPRTGQQD
jgi:hypothetical protein